MIVQSIEQRLASTYRAAKGRTGDDHPAPSSAPAASRARAHKPPGGGDDQAPRVTTHLILTLVGPRHEGLLAELAQRIFEAGGNVEESRGTQLAGAQVAYLAITGNWRTLDKLEKQLPDFAATHQLDCTVTRMRADEDDDSAAMPYSVDVVALDQPGVLRALADFFHAHGVVVREWQTRVYRAGSNATRMLSANLLIDIPADRHLASLRADFMDFCDDLNLDGVLDPVKA